jgi:hypothetical protein
MERGREHPPLAEEDGVAPQRAHDFHLRARREEARRPDERPAQGAVRRRGVDGGLERVHLPAIGIALHVGVEQPQARLRRHHRPREQDGARAGAEKRAAASVKLSDRLRPGSAVHELQQGGALAAGQNEPAEAGERLRPADLAHAGAERAQHGRVGREVALQREDADLRAHQPRSCSRSPAGTVAISTPGIAAPSPREASATAAASS